MNTNNSLGSHYLTHIFGNLPITIIDLNYKRPDAVQWRHHVQQILYTELIYRLAHGVDVCGETFVRFHVEEYHILPPISTEIYGILHQIPRFRHIFHFSVVYDMLMVHTTGVFG